MTVPSYGTVTHVQSPNQGQTAGAVAQLTASSAPSAVGPGYLFHRPKRVSDQAMELKELVRQVLGIVYKVPHGTCP